MFPLLVFLVAAFLLLAYEFYAVLTHRLTISEQVWNAYRAYPPIGFLFGLGAGLLLSHFFWGCV